MTHPKPTHDPAALPAYHPLAVATLAQWLALAPRATVLHTGDPESVTDHTVALAWLAVAICPPRLNVGRVALFAVVHDLLEAVTGDTNTLIATPDQRRAKDAEELAALAALRGRVPGQLLAVVDAYEAQEEPEACFVKVLDKLVPRLCHLLNMDRLADMMSPDDLATFMANQEARLRASYPDQPEALALFSEVAALLLIAYRAD